MKPGLDSEIIRKEKFRSLSPRKEPSEGSQVDLRDQGRLQPDNIEVGLTND